MIVIKLATGYKLRTITTNVILVQGHYKKLSPMIEKTALYNYVNDE